jgi:hypothetical protein
MPGEDEAGIAPAGPAMKYSCASCGETNEVLPPKGFSMVKSAEAQRKPKSALTEAIARLEQRLVKKEGRFMESNKRTRELLQENISLRAKLAARSRADQAAKALREAKIPGDILSAADLVSFDPSQWGTQIKMAKRMLSGEQKVESVTGAGARTGHGIDKGGASGDAKAAKDTFKASYEQD